MSKIASSELIINDDGSIYHLNIKPEQLAKDIIFVGDPDRVDGVTKYFDSIEFSLQKESSKLLREVTEGNASAWFPLVLGRTILILF